MVLSSRICERSSNCGCMICSLNYRYSSRSYSHSIVGVFITYFILMYVFSLKELWFASLNVCGKYFGHEPLFFSSLYDVSGRTVKYEDIVPILACDYFHFFLKYEAQKTANYCPSLIHGFLGLGLDGTQQQDP